VWQGRAGDRSPYADSPIFLDSASRVRNTQTPCHSVFEVHSSSAFFQGGNFNSRFLFASLREEAVQV
jgi:hypothetical protein